MEQIVDSCSHHLHGTHNMLDSPLYMKDAKLSCFSQVQVRMNHVANTSCCVQHTESRVFEKHHEISAALQEHTDTLGWFSVFEAYQSDGMRDQKGVLVLLKMKRNLHTISLNITTMHTGIRILRRLLRTCLLPVYQLGSCSAL